MRNLTATLCLTLAVLLFSPTEGWSADFQRGYAAFQSGDYAIALREWTPLAKQGDADAQFNLGLMYANGDGVPRDYKTAVKFGTYLLPNKEIPLPNTIWVGCTNKGKSFPKIIKLR